MFLTQLVELGLIGQTGGALGFSLHHISSWVSLDLWKFFASFQVKNSNSFASSKTVVLVCYLVVTTNWLDKGRAVALAGTNHSGINFSSGAFCNAGVIISSSILTTHWLMDVWALAGKDAFSTLQRFTITNALSMASWRVGDICSLGTNVLSWKCASLASLWKYSV